MGDGMPYIAALITLDPELAAGLSPRRRSVAASSP